MTREPWCDALGELDVPRLRGAIRDALAVCLPTANWDQLIALGELHRADADVLLRAGVPLPPAEDSQASADE